MPRLPHSMMRSVSMSSGGGPMSWNNCSDVMRSAMRPEAGSPCDKLIAVGTRCRRTVASSAPRYVFARTQLLLGVGESRFEHFANRLPRAAVELNQS